MDAPQLALFEADRYHDPRVLADRTRRRSIAMLRPVRRCAREELRPVTSLDAWRAARSPERMAAPAAASRAAA
jgi:hypothetical protein